MIAAVILAGGQGRRLGGADKAMLMLGRHSALEHLLGRLARQVDDIAISANGDPARFAAHGRAVLGDGPFAGQGPLAGLLAGLDWAAGRGANALLSITCDSPFIPGDLIARLAPGPSRAASLGQSHHLVALWPVAQRARLRRLLTEPGSRGVADFAAGIGMRTVAFPPVAFPGGAWDPFLNINTPEDLAMARAIAEQVEIGG